MAETVKHRILRQMQERHFTREQLEEATDIRLFRLRDILDVGLPPDPEELGKIADALSVHPVELEGGLAHELGQILREEGHYDCFTELRPQVELQTGLRAKDTPKDESVSELLDEVIKKHNEEHHIWQGHGPFPWWKK